MLAFSILKTTNGPKSYLIRFPRTIFLGSIQLILISYIPIYCRSLGYFGIDDFALYSAHVDSFLDVHIATHTPFGAPLKLKYNCWLYTWQTKLIKWRPGCARSSKANSWLYLSPSRQEKRSGYSVSTRTTALEFCNTTLATGISKHAAFTGCQ